MKLNKNFVLREIAGEVMLVPTGEMSAKINGFVALNGVGALIVKKLNDGAELSEIVAAVTDEFDTDTETATDDVRHFLETLVEKGIAEE